MTSPTRGADPTAPLVLVADDEPDVLGSVVPFMERAGFRVISANDGKLALDEIRRHGPDACVLDVLMPGADGREVLRTLRCSSSSRYANWESAWTASAGPKRAIGAISSTFFPLGVRR